MIPRIADYLKNTNPDSFVGVIMFDYITTYYENAIYYLLKTDLKNKSVKKQTIEKTKIIGG